MELLGLGGLAIAGHILKNNNEPKIKQINKKNKPDKNFDNIYSSNNKSRVKSKAESLAKDRFQKSKDPQKTGIIPAYYNKQQKNNKISIDASEDSTFSEDSGVENFADTKSCGSGISKGPEINMNDPACFLKAADNLNDNNKFENRVQNKKVSDKNNFLSQFEQLSYDNPSDPVSSNAVPHVTGSKAAPTKLEIERNLALNGGYSNFEDNSDMTYGIVDKDKLTHNNMVPFFSSRTGMGVNPQQEQKITQISQRKMEQFSGSTNNLEYRPKTERRPVFNPTSELTNLYGTPVMTDYYESRYIPGYERRSELPFQQVKINPGLNLGYNELGTQGNNDNFRVLPKTVDELRAANKPKVSYAGVTNHGMKGQRGPIANKVNKRRPDTFNEKKVEDMLPSMSYFKAPTLRDNVDPNNLSTINRGAKETPHYGPAQRTEAKDARQNVESFDPKITRRDQIKNYIGPAGVEQVGRSYAFDHKTAIPDTTNREEFAKTDRNGLIGNAEGSKSYAFDIINGVQDLTLRDQTGKADRAGFIGNTITDKTYVFDNTNGVQDATKRDIHSKIQQVGPLGNNEHTANYVYDSINGIQEPTNRDIHNKTDRAGNFGNNTFNKAYVYDPTNTIQDPTKRDIHNKPDRVGQFGNTELNKTYVYDPTNTIQDPTKRDIHNKPDRVGQFGNTELNKAYAFDHNNAIQDLTKRNIHSKPDRVGQFGNTELNKAYAFDHNNAIQDLTKRDIYAKTERVGQFGNTELNKAYAFDHSNAIQDLTKRDQTSKTERAGHFGTGETDKTYAFDHNNAIQDLTKRDMYAKTERAGHIGNGEITKQYVLNTNNAIYDLTKRDIHGKNDRTGLIGNAELSKQYLFDSNNAIQDLTKRNLYDKTDRAGFVGNAELGKTYAFDSTNAIQDATKRDMYSKTDRAGQMGNAALDKTYVFDSVNAIQDLTKRDQHNSARKGGIGTAALDKTYVFDNINAIQDATKRDQHNSSRAGGIGNNQLDKTYAFDYDTNIPDPTKRQQHEKYDRAGKSLGFHETQRGRGDATSMRTNTSKEIIAQGRGPTTSNYEKGPIIDYTVVRVKDPIQITRELYPDNMDNAVNRIQPVQNTYHATLPQQSWHFYSFVDENLKNNVYINNMIHKASS
jgi:hypothetical protein